MELDLTISESEPESEDLDLKEEDLDFDLDLPLRDLTTSLLNGVLTYRTANQNAINVNTFIRY